MSPVARFNAAFLILLVGIATCVGWLHHRNDPPRHVANLVIATLLAPFGGQAIYFLPRQGIHADGTQPFGLSQANASRSIAIAKVHTPRSLATARGLLLILMISLAAAIVAQVYGCKSRFGVTRERVLRGPRKADFTSVAHRVHDAVVVCLQDTFWKPDQRVRLGQVRLEPGDETQHMLVVGGTGSGKSAAIQGVLADLLCWRPLAKVVVLDLAGALHSQFGRPGDLVINPFRPTTSVKWSPLHEVHESTVMLDCARIAAGLLPGDGTPQNQEWSQFARPVLSAVLKRLFERCASSTEFARAADPTHLEELIVGCPEAGILKTSSSGSSGSIQFMVIQALQKIGVILSEFEKCSGSIFSIRDWVGDGRPGIIWITFDESQRALLRPFHSLLASELSKAALDLHPSNSRRLFIFADELGSLGCVDGLQDLLEKGRKFGVSVVACLQSIAQLTVNYGRDPARILIDNFKNLLVLNTPGFESADYFSKTLGLVELERVEVSCSDSPSGRVRNISKRREIRPVVLPSEISSLPNLQGFLKKAGNPGMIYITRIRFPATRGVES